jgi:hypothetical protein
MDLEGPATPAKTRPVWWGAVVIELEKREFLWLVRASRVRGALNAAVL